MRSVFFIFFFLRTILPLTAQNYSVDSLKSIINSDSFSDSMKVEAYQEMVSLRSLPLKTRLEYSDKLLAFAKKLKNTEAIAQTYIWRGHIYKKLTDNDKSAEAYFKAATLAHEIDDSELEAIAYGSLGSVYRITEEFDRALLYYNMGIKRLRESDNTKNLAVSLMNTGELYRTSQKFDTALLYFEEASQLFDSIGYKIGQAYNLGNIGLVLAEKEDYAVAEDYLNLAIKILEAEQEYYPIIVYNLSMADILVSKNEIAEAIELVERNLTIAQEQELKEQIRDAAQKLAELYEKVFNYKKALYYQKQYMQVEDSINSASVIREMADLRSEFEISQKQSEVDLLTAEKKFQSVLLVILVLILIFIAVVAFLYYRHALRTKRLNNQLVDQKEEIESQRDQLQSLNETKEKFLSIISHDLLGPINAFKGLLPIMNIAIEKNNQAELKHIYEHFNSSVNRLADLLTNLLDWTVTRKGNISYEPEQLTVKSLIEEQVALFTTMAQSKNISINTDIEDDLTVWADQNSLKTILRNLMSNALKFTDKEGSIRLSAHRENDSIMLSVSDNGIGMPQEKIDQLLHEKRFARSYGTQGEKGVGLGLQLVKEFTELNRGELHISSKENVGTTFKLRIPIHNKAN